MKQHPPNILFILADDLGYGDLGLFGNEKIRTPHLDELGHQGVVLTQHYSASPLCAPARAALLTGRYNHRTGAVDVPSNRGLDRIALSERTLGDVFAKSGYATGMIGKWHNGLHDMRYHPNARGFGEFAGFLNGGMDYRQWVLDRNGRPEKGDGRYLTDVFSEEAVDFIKCHRRNPFLLYLSYNAPHLPLQAPEKMIQFYRDQGDLTEEVSTLYAMIERMDEGIGRVLEEIERQGLARNTIVVFTSDNGPQPGPGLDRFNGPFRGAKGDALEGGIRVPAVVRAPDHLPSGLQVHDMIHFCDWLPTLVGLAGIPKETSLPLDGYDATCRLRGERGNIPDIRFWQRNRYEPLPRCNGAMRDGPWKLVWPMRKGGDWKDPDDNASYRMGMTAAHRILPVAAELPKMEITPAGNPQLFKVDVDPHEERDLSAEHPERIDTMTRAWDAWFEEVTAQWRSTFATNTATADHPGTGDSDRA